jgi:hypothetical protein
LARGTIWAAIAAVSSSQTTTPSAATRMLGKTPMVESRAAMSLSPDELRALLEGLHARISSLLVRL